MAYYSLHQRLCIDSDSILKGHHGTIETFNEKIMQMISVKKSDQKFWPEI